MLAMLANVELGGADKEDVGHDFSKGSSMIFSWFGMTGLKESVASVCFANSTLSIFEDVEVEGLVKDVEDEGTDNDIEGVVVSMLP